MIRWTGLAPWELEFPFPGCLISTFLAGRGGTRTSYSQLTNLPPLTSLVFSGARRNPETCGTHQGNNKGDLTLLKRSSRGGARTCSIPPGGEAAPLLWDTPPCRVPGQPSRHLRLQMPGFDSSPLPHHTFESAHRLLGSFGGELGLNSVPGDLFRVTFGNRGRPLEMAGDSRLEQVAVVLRPALCQARPSSKTARIPNVDARVQPPHKPKAISDCWARTDFVEWPRPRWASYLRSHPPDDEAALLLGDFISHRVLKRWF